MLGVWSYTNTCPCWNKTVFVQLAFRTRADQPMLTVGRAFERKEKSFTRVWLFSFCYYWHTMQNQHWRCVCGFFFFFSRLSATGRPAVDMNVKAVLSWGFNWQSSTTCSLTATMDAVVKFTSQTQGRDRIFRWVFVQVVLPFYLVSRGLNGLSTKTTSRYELIRRSVDSMSFCVLSMFQDNAVRLCTDCLPASKEHGTKGICCEVEKPRGCDERREKMWVCGSRVCLARGQPSLAAAIKHFVSKENATQSAEKRWVGGIKMQQKWHSYD